MGMIQRTSVEALYIDVLFNGVSLGTATGFVASTTTGKVLLTNRHVVTGRHQVTNECLSRTGGIPNQLAIHFHRPNLGSWIAKVEPILDKDNQPLWKEHQVLGARADFVAVPLSDLDGVQLYESSLGNGDPPIAISVTDKASVVGFPFGLRSGGGFPVWATGWIATEPAVEHDDLPIFLVDMRSRRGQSGSPVVAHRSGADVVWLENHAMIANGQPATRFLGIYSGRVNEESDLGVVWKVSAIQELINQL